MVWQLNQRAYDAVSKHYHVAYFDIPPLAEAFEGWLVRLPAGGHILDAGCGHGDPVIRRLLERGFRVTGSDLSLEMLQRARQQFPQADFLQKTTTTLNEQAVYDGVCSFNSLLYLDKIDFLNSILQIYKALKPGGLLFLYGRDIGPRWRGDPVNCSLTQWMWSWFYGVEDAADLLEEHGYFKVLETRKVEIVSEEQDRIRRELVKQAEEFRKNQEDDPSSLEPTFRVTPTHDSYTYVVIAQRLEK